MDLRLILTNVGYIIGILLNFALIALVFSRGPRKTSNITFSLLALSLIVFEISHIIGINQTDGDASRTALMGTTAIVFIAAFGIHWVLSILGRENRSRIAITLGYTTAVFLFILYIVSPETYLATSVHKPVFDYIPSYYSPGTYFWLLPAYYFISLIYIFWIIIRSYATADTVLKNRLKYFIATLIFGYGMGAINFLLVYDIPVNPGWAVFLSLYTIPLAYGILKYELMDIKIVAKRAFVYAVSIGLISIVLNFISYSNEYILMRISGFPRWLVPIVTSVIGVGIGAFVWNKIKEVDILKYSFISGVTHKFRTPLTHIKWSAEELRNAKSVEEKEKALSVIQKADERLVELTDILLGISEGNQDFNTEVSEKRKCSDVTEKVIAEQRSAFTKKGVSLETIFPTVSPEISINYSKIKFLINTLLNNALTYTPSGGKVTIEIGSRNFEVFWNIKDTGIGIDSDELPYIFNKFYRSKSAVLADTEGLGVSLFAAQEIAKLYRGRITASSQGEGLGSVFTLTLPVA